MMKYVTHYFPESEITLFTIFSDAKPTFFTEDEELIYILETKQLITQGENHA